MRGGQLQVVAEPASEAKGGRGRGGQGPSFPALRHTFPHSPPPPLTSMSISAYPMTPTTMLTRCMPKNQPYT